MIEISQERHVGIISFNNELNLLSVAFIAELNKTLKAFDEDINIHVIILTSKTCAFSAGAQLKELISCDINSTDPIDDWQFLATVTKPVIACVTGACLGGGFEIALMCDFIFASEHAKFGFPEIKLGLLPGGGGTQRICQRISVQRAKELMFLGESVPAKTAHAWGLVDFFVESEPCLESAINFASKIASQSLNSQIKIKKLLHLNDIDSFNANLINERIAFYARLKTSEAKDKITMFFDRNKK